MFRVYFTLLVAIAYLANDLRYVILYYTTANDIFTLPFKFAL